LVIGSEAARRLRVETAVTLKWLAAELHMGSWTQVAKENGAWIVVEF
jgi:hypothetical protein